MKKQKKGFSIKINLTNRWLYTLIAIGILAIVGVGVWAFGTSNPSTFGHSAGEIEEADPTVLASVKDGVSWSEISNRPPGLDDGDSDTHGNLSCVVKQCWYGKSDSKCLCTSEYCLTYCPDGYIATGGGFQNDAGTPGAYSMPWLVGSNSWFCVYTEYCYARCCKVV